MSYQNEEADNQLAAINRNRIKSHGQINPQDNQNKKFQRFVFIVLGILTLVLIKYFYPEPIQIQNTENQPLQFTSVQNRKLLPGGMSLFSRIYETKSKIQEPPQIQEAIQNKFENKQPAEKYVTPKIKKLLKEGRNFDIHYFVQDFHSYQKPRQINKATLSVAKDFDQKRPLLKITKSAEQLESLISQMMNPFIKYDQDKLSQQVLGALSFGYQLSLFPQRKDYLEAQYYHYDQNYHIGNYGRQLPLCLALVGKNNANVVLRLYESIRRQNYTNYRIAHVDDGSDDGTYQVMTKYLNEHKFMKDRTTFIMQPYQRNAFYNRHYANTQVCRDGDIIIDLDTDDYLIGRQVFQLVNSLYQGGYNYKDKNEELWSLFLNFVYSKYWFITPTTPVSGQVRPLVIQEQVYRISDDFRTAHLRTYLWKLYQKINSTDFIDPANIKKGEFYGQSVDLFMMDSIFQLSAPKHVRILDQYVYFYTGSGNRDRRYPEYCSVSGRSLPIYQALGSLDDLATRGQPKMPPFWRQKRRKQVEQILKKLKQDVLSAYQKEKKRVLGV